MYFVMSSENGAQMEPQQDDPFATILAEIRRSEVRMDARLKKLEKYM